MNQRRSRSRLALECPEYALIVEFLAQVGTLTVTKVGF